MVIFYIQGYPVYDWDSKVREKLKYSEANEI